MAVATPIWDLPLRLFKWGFAISVLGAILTARDGDMERHAQFGFAAMALVLFRVIWGVIGSETARFVQFVKGPAAIRAYLGEGAWSGIGHNPLGALSILALLALVAFKFTTGIFANDDIFYDGPWAGWAGKATSDWLTGLHHDATWPLYALIALHLAAVFWHTGKGDNLIGPMIGGMKPLEGAAAEAGARLAWAPAIWAVPALAAGVLVAGAAMRYWLL
ncbi:MAG: cytochrome b/b6 domain-containing protein [Pseudomonadota bacterium]